MAAFTKYLSRLSVQERLEFIAGLEDLCTKSNNDQFIIIENVKEICKRLKENKSKLWLNSFVSDRTNNTISYTNESIKNDSIHYMMKVKSGVNPEEAFNKYEEYRSLPNNKKFISPIIYPLKKQAEVCHYLEDYFELAN